MLHVRHFELFGLLKNTLHVRHVRLDVTFKG